MSLLPAAPQPKRPPTTPGLQPEDRGRIILLGVGLLVCLALAAGLYAYVRSSYQPPPKPPEPGPAIGEGPAIDISPAPLFPEEEAAEIQRILLKRVSELPPVSQGVDAVDPEVYEYLVDQATLNARVLNLRSEGFDAAPDTERILADPGAHVGRLIRVSGELLDLRKLPYEGKGRQVLEVRRGTVRDAKGRLFTFTWPVGNSLEPDPVEPGKGWARVRGLFYKSWPAADAKQGGKAVPTLHLVLQGRPEPDYAPVEFSDIDPAWMGAIHDSTAGDMLSDYEPPFFYLLNMMRKLGPEGFEGWLKAKAESAPGANLWPPEDFTGRYKELLDRPEAYRLRPVRYSGFLVRPQLETVPPNPGGLEKVAVGFLVDTDFAPAVWVFAPRSLVEQGFKVNDRVRVDGIFYKRRAFQPAGGGPLSQAVMIVAGKIVPAPLGKPFGKDLLLLIIGVMVLVAAGLGWVILRARREDRVAEERRRDRMKRKRTGPPAPATPPAPPADAPPPADPAP